ncbi:MAG TPA: hypothetical protein VL263_02990 [Vicinamibacterales bacterium]|nr:hypothetical protein [Vicinamibacterales bacterium]
MRAASPTIAGGVADDRRQQHERQHGQDVFDHEPADRDVAGLCVEIVVVGEHPHEHHRAGDGQRHAEDQAGRPVPPEGARQHDAKHRGDATLCDRPGNGHASDREQLLDVELQADAEHQENDADLGHLFGEVRVGDEAWRVRADERTGKQIAGDWRETEAMGEIAEHEGGAEPARQGKNQIVLVHAPARVMPSSVLRGPARRSPPNARSRSPTTLT